MGKVGSSYTFSLCNHLLGIFKSKLFFISLELGLQSLWEREQFSSVQFSLSKRTRQEEKRKQLLGDLKLNEMKTNITGHTHLPQCVLGQHSSWNCELSILNEKNSL